MGQFEDSALAWTWAAIFWADAMVVGRVCYGPDNVSFSGEHETADRASRRVDGQPDVNLTSIDNSAVRRAKGKLARLAVRLRRLDYAMLSNVDWALKKAKVGPKFAEDMKDMSLEKAKLY